MIVRHVKSYRLWINLIVVAMLVATGRAADVTWSYELLAADGSNVLQTPAGGTIHTSVAYGAGATDSRIINGVEFNTLVAGNHDNPAFSWIADRNAAETRYGTFATYIAYCIDKELYKAIEYLKVQVEVLSSISSLSL